MYIINSRMYIIHGIYVSVNIGNLHYFTRKPIQLY